MNFETKLYRKVMYEGYAELCGAVLEIALAVFWFDKTEPISMLVAFFFLVSALLDLGVFFSKQERLKNMRFKGDGKDVPKDGDQ